MTIEKLTEFAKTGQKNTDDLDLEAGFIVNRKPARQWFNWLFSTLTTKINEIIDADFMPKSDVVDNLTTNDATKVASARTVKELQDNKLEADDLKDASTEQKGVVQLNNTLTSTSNTQALTAAQGKVLGDRDFGVGQNWINVTVSRTNGTTYTNSTGKAIVVWVSIRDTNGNGFSVTINGTSVLSTTGDLPSGNYYPFIFVVPPNQTYRVSWAGGTNNELIGWSELR